MEQCVGKISIKKNIKSASLTSKYSQMFYMEEINSHESQQTETYQLPDRFYITAVLNCGTKTRPSMARPSVEQILMLNKGAFIAS